MSLYGEHWESLLLIIITSGTQDSRGLLEPVNAKRIHPVPLTLAWAAFVIH